MPETQTETLAVEFERLVTDYVGDARGYRAMQGGAQALHRSEGALASFAATNASAISAALRDGAQRDAMPGANAALIAEARRQAGLAGYSLEGNTLTALATALAAAESRAQTLAAFAKRVLADDAAAALREGEATP